MNVASEGITQPPDVSALVGVSPEEVLGEAAHLLVVPVET